MADVERVDPPEPPPVETPPEPPIEAVDSDGVPFKNRAEEYRRKYESERELNDRYMRELGQRQAAPPPPQQTGGEYEIEVDGQKHKFDRASVELIRKLAREESNQTAQSFVGRTQLAQEVADKEIRAEAEKVYREEVLTNSWYSQWNDDAKQAVAIKEARARVLQRKLDAANKGAVNQSQSQAAQAQAQGASLPGTGGGNYGAGERDRYIKDFMADPVHHKYLQSMWKLKPDSPEGQAKLRRAAEKGWEGSRMSERFAHGAEMQKRGGQ